MQRHIDLAVQNLVFIRFHAVCLAWMEGKRHLLRRLDPHIVRQALVERKADLITRNPALGIENSHISHRMDTRIRPARPDDLDILF